MLEARRLEPVSSERACTYLAYCGIYHTFLVDTVRSCCFSASCVVRTPTPPSVGLKIQIDETPRRSMSLYQAMRPHHSRQLFLRFEKSDVIQPSRKNLGASRVSRTYASNSTKEASVSTKHRRHSLNPLLSRKAN